MKILYDHQIFALQNHGGISRYFFELMNNLYNDDEINFELSISIINNSYINSRCFSEQKNTSIGRKANEVFSKFYKPLCLKRYLNYEKSKRTLLKQDFDIFHPTYYDPYFLDYLGKKKFILTIHDMIHEIFPEYYSLSDKTIPWKRNLAEKADRIIAVSENTKKDIVKFLDINPHKINVIYHGSSFAEYSSNGVRDHNLARQLPKKYLLFVGSRDKYKNFYFFAEAIASILLRDLEMRLICVGGGALTSSEIDFLRNLRIDHKVDQYNVGDEILVHLYKNALCFIFPSMYEGFGIPVLESFACGCPAIISNSSSLPEVGGNAAIYFDPKDVTSLKDSVERVIFDDALREDLRIKGREQLIKFSWKKTAEETKNLYKSIK